LFHELGTASTSNIEILERFQSKALRMTVDAPCYVPNTVIRRDLQIPAVKEEILRYNSQYNARLKAHPNDHRNSRTSPIESLAHDSERTLVCAEYDYLMGYPNTSS
jgi:hypothetical protein